jgi:hypothetical protein
MPAVLREGEGEGDQWMIPNIQGLINRLPVDP